MIQKNFEVYITNTVLSFSIFVSNKANIVFDYVVSIYLKVAPMVLFFPDLFTNLF